jgi:hypothetical protein
MPQLTTLPNTKEMANPILPAPATAGPVPPSTSSSNLKAKAKPKTYHEITSAYAARFGRNDDQTTVTDEQRQMRQQTAAEGADQ